jgi:hypothetical protein
MTVSTQASMAQSAARNTLKKVRCAGKSGPARLACVCLLVALPLMAVVFVPAAFAEPVRVSASADPGLSATQGRQQALTRALAEAVYQGALRLLTAPAPEARLSALRAFLAPNALDFVQNYQEVSTAQPATSALGAPSAGPKTQGDALMAPLGASEPQDPSLTEQAAGTPPSAGGAQPQTTSAATGGGGGTTLQLDVNLQRSYLRETLVRLGFFAGARHPGVFALRLGAGVKEKDVAFLAKDNVLLGLARVKVPTAKPDQTQGAERVEVTLERLPQGYYKAVLRQGALALAADSPELPKLWLDVWAKYFTDSRQQPGPGEQSLTIAGFAGVDAVQDFEHVLGTWDEAVQDPSIADMDLGVDGVSARFICRIVNQQALDTRLSEALPARRLTLVKQTGLTAP